MVISAAFFGGKPAKILDAWSVGEFELVISDEVLEEYREALDRMQSKFPDVETYALLEAVARHGIRVLAARLPEPICTDRDDVKFLECALAGGAAFVITGDRALLRCDGYAGVRVVRPVQFLNADRRA